MGDFTDPKTKVFVRGFTLKVLDFLFLRGIHNENQGKVYHGQLLVAFRLFELRAKNHSRGGGTCSDSDRSTDKHTHDKEASRQAQKQANIGSWKTDKELKTRKGNYREGSSKKIPSQNVATKLEGRGGGGGRRPQWSGH